ncbi:tetratricopeptide repeat protein [Segeticoccus rhizosphaerae]|jgi:Flp pilus assembly protein TadD|uniref:tetratricopeptide repeat protein n=1 Tax=Segeticoccus rhizosphaerae TaxID=1104777 RepID=UPI0010BFC18E|nr:MULTISPECIES: tetratricopeptide repeat protein [Intrasporangiaceae]
MTTPFTTPNADSTYELFRVAEFQLELARPLEALRTLEPIADEIADSASGQLLLARAYFHSAQLSRAEKSFRRVLELDPADHYARFALGRSLERQGRRDEAVGQYRLAVAMHDSPEYRERLDHACQ